MTARAVSLLVVLSALPYTGWAQVPARTELQVNTNTTAIQLFGDAASPFLIGVASDRIGLRIPVLATGALMVVAGFVLLAGRKALVRDLKAAAR